MIQRKGPVTNNKWRVWKQVRWAAHPTMSKQWRWRIRSSALQT